MKKLLSFLMLLSIAAVVQADEAVLRSLTGTVLVQSASSRTLVPLTAGQPIQRGDHVRVGPGSVAQIVFPTGDALLVKENSTLVLEKDAQGTIVSFDLGEFLIGLNRKLEKGQSFRVKTPAGIAAVRGTAFWGKTDIDKRSTYACFTGVVDITAANKTVSLMPGQTLSFRLGKNPGAPKASTIPADYIKTFAVDGSLQGIDTIIAKQKPE